VAHEINKDWYEFSWAWVSLKGAFTDCRIGWVNELLARLKSISIESELEFDLSNKYFIYFLVLSKKSRSFQLENKP
jgi:hypothetical protein